MLRSWLGSALFGAVPDFIALQSHDFAIACDIARWHRTIIDSSNCSCDFSFQDGHYPAPEICRADIASGSLLLQTLQHRTLHAGRTTLRWQRCTGQQWTHSFRHAFKLAFCFCSQLYGRSLSLVNMNCLQMFWVHYITPTDHGWCFHSHVPCLFPLLLDP